MIRTRSFSPHSTLPLTSRTTMSWSCCSSTEQKWDHFLQFPSCSHLAFGVLNCNADDITLWENIELHGNIQNFWSCKTLPYGHDNLSNSFSKVNALDSLGQTCLHRAGREGNVQVFFSTCYSVVQHINLLKWQYWNMIAHLPGLSDSAHIWSGPKHSISPGL